MFANRPRKLTAIGRTAVLAPLFLLTILHTGCSSTLTPSERAASADSTVGWLVEKYGAVRDPQVEPMINRVTNRLSTAIYRSALETDLSRSQAEQFHGYTWEIIVLDTEAPNAFSAGAGRIVVTRGLIAALHNESEFAAIIAHEMSHEILGHNNEALEKSYAKQRQADEDSSDGSVKGPARSGAAAPAYAFNPSYEIAADTLGVKILSVARYNTNGALFALTLGYRNGERIVDDNQAEWARYRTAKLKQLIDQTGEAEPATVSTREFNKVRWDLGGG